MILVSFGYNINLYSEEYIAGKVIENSLSSSKLLPEYKLGPGDRLLIRVFGYDEFNSEVIVLPDGTIVRTFGYSSFEK